MDEKNTNIICYRGDRSQCFFARIHVPMAAVARNNEKYKITVAGFIEKDQIGAYDLAIFQRQYKEEVFNALLSMKKKGTKIVYEIDDDLFNIPEWNPASKVLGRKAVQENVKHFLSQSDACFTTNEYLAGIYSPYCKMVYILPNSLDYKRFHPSPKNSIKPVVCWQGSTTHDRDVQLISPAITRLHGEGKCFVKMWSFDVPGIYNVPNVPFEAFYQTFSQLDGYIGLAPLTTVPFNRSKSNLKWLEYTAQGMVTVASNFGPYAETITDGENGFLISNNKDWYDVVNTLLDDKILYNRILENAQKFVKENYDINVTYKYWENTLNEILTGSVESELPRLPVTD